MRIAIGSDHHGLARKGRSSRPSRPAATWCWTSARPPPSPSTIPTMRAKSARRCCATSSRPACSSAAAEWEPPSPPTRSAGSGPLPAQTPRPPSRVASSSMRTSSASPRNALDDGAAIEVTLTWIGAKFSGDEAHARQVAKLAQLEAGPVQERAVPRRRLHRLSRSERPRAPPRWQPPRRYPPHRRLRQRYPPPRPTPPAEAVAPAASLEPAPATVPAAPAPLPLTRDALEHPVTEETLAFLESHDFLDRFWVKDASLWRGDAEAVRNRLGWLTSPAVMRGHVEELRTFADEIRRLQFSHVVVLGTGGSSRAARAVCGVFGSKMGFPDLFVLDSPDPAAVKHMLDSITLGRTLVRRLQQVGDHAGDPRALRVLPSASRDHGAEAGSAVRRHHRPGHAARGAGGRDGLPADLPERPVHRRPLLGAELLRPRPRRPHGRRHQGPGRAEPGHGRALR